VTAEDDGRDVEDIDGGAQGDPQGVGGGIDGAPGTFMMG